MITHPATMTHVDVPKEERYARGLTDGLVRISVGIEDIHDLIADFERVFELVKPGQNKNVGRVGKGAGTSGGNVKLSAARLALW